MLILNVGNSRRGRCLRRRLLCHGAERSTRRGVADRIRMRHGGTFVPPQASLLPRLERTDAPAEACQERPTSPPMLPEAQQPAPPEPVPRAQPEAGKSGQKAPPRPVPLCPHCQMKETTADRDRKQERPQTPPPERPRYGTWMGHPQCQSSCKWQRQRKRGAYTRVSAEMAAEQKVKYDAACDREAPMFRKACGGRTSKPAENRHSPRMHESIAKGTDAGNVKMKISGPGDLGADTG